MTNLVKVEALTAAELLQEFELSDEGAADVLVPDTAPQISIERLMEAGFYSDAVKLLAHGLPKREAVWWACLAARRAQTPETDSKNLDALHCAEAWAKKPTEENRKRCLQSAELTQYKTPASWAATAAAWSAGSMAKEGEPEIPPPPYLYAHAVAGSVCLAAVMSDPENAGNNYQQMLSQGLDLARGGTGQM